MPNVLIRDVAAEDLDDVRAAAAAAGQSLQSYLREVVRTHVEHLRRQAALRRITEDLRDQPAVPDEARAAVLDAIAADHAERADRLADSARR